MNLQVLIDFLQAAVISFVVILILGVAFVCPTVAILMYFTTRDKREKGGKR